MNIPAISCLLAFTASVYANGYGLNGLVYAPRHASVDYYAYPRYAFNYAVNDPHTGDNKAQWEKRDGDVVKGAYSLVEPDGNLRIVEYWADDKSGFNAVVKKLGPNLHPVTLPASIYKAPIPILGHASAIAPISVAPISKMAHAAGAPLISGPIVAEPIFPGPIVAKPILPGPIVTVPIKPIAPIKSATPITPIINSIYQDKIGDVGLGYAGVGHAGLGYAGVGHAGLDYAGVGYARLGYAGSGHNGLGQAGLGHAGLGYAGLSHTGLGYTGVQHYGLSKAAVYPAPLPILKSRPLLTGYGGEWSQQLPLAPPSLPMLQAPLGLGLPGYGICHNCHKESEATYKNEFSQYNNMLPNLWKSKILHGGVN